MKKRIKIFLIITILLFTFFFISTSYASYNIRAADVNQFDAQVDQFKNIGDDPGVQTSFHNIIGAVITLIQVFGVALALIIIVVSIIRFAICKSKLTRLDQNEENYQQKYEKLGAVCIKARKRILIAFVTAFILFAATGILGITKTFKPIIYIYPENDSTSVSVRLSNPEKVTCSYPKYNNGWDVVVDSDGTIKENGREYYALYWEGLIGKKDFKDGFVVKGEDTAEFLEEKLKVLGLSDREAEEFIIYWLPKMEHNRYNLIRFLEQDELNEEMSLDINPEPDTLIRIQMQYKPLLFNMDIEEQVLEPVERNGYTVVEWGGSQV